MRNAKLVELLPLRLLSSNCNSPRSLTHSLTHTHCLSLSSFQGSSALHAQITYPCARYRYRPSKPTNKLFSLESADDSDSTLGKEALANSWHRLDNVLRYYYSDHRTSNTQTQMEQADEKRVKAKVLNLMGEMILFGFTEQPLPLADAVAQPTTNTQSTNGHKQTCLIVVCRCHCCCNQ